MQNFLNLEIKPAEIAVNFVPRRICRVIFNHLNDTTQIL